MVVNSNAVMTATLLVAGLQIFSYFGEKIDFLLFSKPFSSIRDARTRIEGYFSLVAVRNNLAKLLPLILTAKATAVEHETQFPGGN